MKLTNTAKKQKKEPAKREVIPSKDEQGRTAQDRMAEMIPEEYNKWNKVHGIPEHHFGKVTSAWVGITWGDCRDYMNVRCGCGSTFIQHKHKGPCQVVKT
jgi:hypothetical protein